MFIPFGSRILPSSWVPSISRFSVAYPRGVIFFTLSYVFFSLDTFLFSFSLFLFSLCLFHSESSPSILLVSSHKLLTTSWHIFNLRFKYPCTIGQAARITRKTTVLRANITSDVPWEFQFILSSYSWNLSFILVFLVTGSLISLHVARSMCS